MYLYCILCAATLVTEFCYSFQGAITNILEENVVQPLLVSTSAITLASETVRSILKIDDIVS
jgi:chaperonin GroEL (HSP60 family)